LGFARKQTDGILKEGAAKPLYVFRVSISGRIWGQEGAFLVTGEFKHGGLFSWQSGGMVWRGSGGLDALFLPQCWSLQPCSGQLTAEGIHRHDTGNQGGCVCVCVFKARRV